MKNYDKYSLVTIAFGCFLVVMALFELNFLKDYRYYSFLHQHLPGNLIFLRYFLSLSLRIAIFITAAGLVFRIELFRKITIVIGVLTILTIYWRHPVEVFRQIFDYLAQKNPQVFSLRKDIPHIEWVLVGINYMIDITIWIFAIFFFTRKQVKRDFDRIKTEFKN